MKFISLLTVAACLLSFSVNGDITDKGTNQSFPAQVSFDAEGKSYNLQATGAATRKKFFVKVYGVASYLQDPKKEADIFQQFQNDAQAKQLTLKFVHEADVAKVQDGYRESFKNALSDAQYKQLQKEIDAYIALFNKDVKKGDEHIIRWAPGGYVEVIINGTSSGSVKNPEFAKGLWSIWFGQKSIVNRDDLVNDIK